MTAAVATNAQVARARRERIRLGMHSFIATRKDIADAYRERDWEALGHPSWEAYVEAEFSEARVRLSPDERREAVAELRLGGMSTRAIGSALGASEATVRRDLSTASSDAVGEVTGVNGKTYAATRPAPTPGPADAAVTPSADPGATPAPAAESPVLAPPQEPASAPAPNEQLIAAVLEALEGHGQFGRSVAEIWTKTPMGTHSSDVRHALDELVRRGRVTAGPVIRGNARWLLTPEPAGAPSAAQPAGSGPDVAAAPREGGVAAAPPPGSPATWTPEQVEANRREVERKAAIAAAERFAESLVLEVRGMVTTIIDGIDFGAPCQLVTAEMIAECRSALDRLEARVAA